MYRPNIGPIPFPTNRVSSDQRGAEGPDALQVWEKSKLGRHGGHPSLKNDIGLEGCSPLQPGTYKGPILGPSFFRPTEFPAISAAPRDRRAPGLGRNFDSRV